jgi:DNA-directed RNA polymerase sigma subunit (sigma70/sigma32)
MNGEPVEQPVLTPQEKLVLELMAGLVDGRRYTMAEVAGRLKIPEDQVVAVLLAAKRKLTEPEG